MQILMLAREMRRRGHTVVVITLTDQHPTLLPKFLESGIDSFSLGLNKPWDVVNALARARRWAKDWRPDILHSHMVHANLFGRLLRLTANIPVVVSTAQNIDEGGFVRTLAYRVTDRLADITTNVSQDAVAAYIRKGACPPSRIIHIPNGLDLQLFQPDFQARTRVRSELDLDGRFAFFAVGRLFPQKDYPTLINAFATVQKHCDHSQLLIAGDGPCRQSIEAHIASLSLDGVIRMLGYRPDISAMMNAADCFVMSSIWEGAPMALIEAMCCGKEIVTTEFGGAASMVGATGIVVPAGKPDLLAAAMVEVVDRQRPINQAARERAASLFSISTIASTWESIYSRFLPDE